ncbi:MAG: protein translocase subunit SecF [Anaerosomatales bacterium]|nr:protein translocase subunit SecF [Anaerosomatales bacterium]
MRRPAIDFMGNKKWLFAFSALLLAISIGSLAIRGITFGIEFQGGTVMTLIGADEVSTAEVRDALDAAGVADAGNAVIQPTEDGGYLVRTTEDDADLAADHFQQVTDTLGLPEQDVNVTTIGPGWGENVTRAALWALLASLVAILGYVSLRFEYKMSLTAIVALVHDIVITLGIYSLFGLEFTPNTMAALLTILGYSLYDTVVVFHRIRENGQRLVKQTFQQMANESINQVLARSINTSLTSLIPVACLLAFGGVTLKDFAFALFIGMMAGAYSSIGVASPIYALWKEREPKFQALKKKYENRAA